MAVYTYNQLVKKATECFENVQKKYVLDMSDKWSYYFAKAVLKPKKDIPKINFEDNPNPQQDKIGRQATRTEYIKIAKDLTAFVEKHKRLPNYVEYKGFKLSPRLLTYTFAKVLMRYSKNNKLQDEVTLNNKVFTKPLETSNKVYAYFIKIFNKGKKIKTVDGILEKIQGRGYGYYYDDHKSNKEVIDQLAKNTKDDPNDPNCTDSCQMVQNCIQQLVDWKLYKKVECLHVQCKSGGHVKLRITKNDGSTFIRDVACIISDNGKPLNCVWCTNTPKAVNPAWYMSNLNR